ncbi:hypothetical protein BK120_08170 [Paenibacillus sp. FSL A5-0031]|nr:hypothetical protein BK120_08170 [Paenibacillus sp. FSL A5-0031]
MKAVKNLLWTTGVCEGLLGVPVLGGFIIFATSWSLLPLMLVIHIITLIACKRINRPIYPSVLGVAASALGWIPFLGMTLHILAAVFLIRSAVIETKRIREVR